MAHFSGAQRARVLRVWTGIGAQRARQVLATDGIQTRHDRRRPHHVPQLAHVAGPRMTEQPAHGRWIDARSHAGLAADVVEETADQDGDVSLPLAQRRQLDLQLAQPVIEVGAKRARRHARPEVHGAGRDHAHVELPFGARADALDRSSFEDAEQLGLQRQGEAVDLVEEQGSVVGLLEEPWMLGGRPAERAARMAEKDGLGELDGRGRHVVSHERAGAPRRSRMKRPGQQLLPGPGLAHDQHRLAARRQ